MICNIFIVGGSVKQVKSMPLSKVIEETIHVKRDTGRRARYVKGLAQYLSLFARGREHMPIDEIGLPEIEAWFDTRGESPVTRASNIGRLSALFSVAWRRGYIEENPCDKMDRPFIDRKPPKILTLRHIARALIWTKRNRPDFLAWLTMATLAGIRPEECDKLRAGDIDLARAEIRVDARVSKIRRRRIVHLTPAAVAWLKVAAFDGLQMSHSTRRRRIRELRAALRLGVWPQDILRHSAASYMLAHVEDAGKVANELGNSAAILQRHYKELVSREEGSRFMHLLPSRNMMRRWGST